MKVSTSPPLSCVNAPVLSAAKKPVNQVVRNARNLIVIPRAAGVKTPSATLNSLKPISAKPPRVLRNASPHIQAAGIKSKEVRVHMEKRHRVLDSTPQKQPAGVKSGGIRMRTEKRHGTVDTTPGFKPAGLKSVEVRVQTEKRHGVVDLTPKVKAAGLKSVEVRVHTEKRHSVVDTTPKIKPAGLKSVEIRVHTEKRHGVVDTTPGIKPAGLTSAQASSSKIPMAIRQSRPGAARIGKKHDLPETTSRIPKAARPLAQDAADRKKNELHVSSRRNRLNG